jgi:hypothetical protein
MALRNDEKLADDEFDVELLVKKLYHLAARGCYKLLYPVRLLLNSPKLLVAGVLFAAGVAFVIKSTQPKIYMASFIIRPHNKADLFYVNLFYDLERIITDLDFDALARELKISKEQTYKVHQIALQPIRVGNKSADTIDIAEIVLMSSDVRMFDTLQDRVMNYIRGNEHYRKIERLRRAEVADMKVKIQRDLEEMDSMKRLLTLNLQPRNAGGFVYGEPIDPANVYEEGLKLYKQQMSLAWQEEYADNFELIKGCVPTMKPVYPRWKPILLYCEAVALLLLFGWNYYLVKRK